eukprot:2320269-Rhodomonas_salina.4
MRPRGRWLRYLSSYALCCTGIAYGATRCAVLAHFVVLRAMRYCGTYHATPCPVLTPEKGCARPSTGIVYGLLLTSPMARCHVQYGASRALRHVQYCPSTMSGTEITWCAPRLGRRFGVRGWKSKSPPISARYRLWYGAAR